MIPQPSSTETAPILPLPPHTEGTDKPSPARARPRRHSWLNTLAVISRRITGAPTATDAIRDMVDMLASAFDFECITYYEPAPGGEMLNLVHAAGNNRDRLAGCTPWPVDSGVLGMAYRTATTVLVNDTSCSPVYVNALPDTNAELAVPLVDDDGVIGVLDIEARHRGFFSDTAVEVVEAIAAQAVVVRRVAWLRRREEQQLREQRAVHVAALDILAARPWEETLRYVTSQLRQLSGATAAGLYLVEPDRRSLVLATSDGMPDHAVGSRMPIDAGLSGRVAVSGCTQVTRDYSTWEGRAPNYNGSRWHAAAATPLHHGGEVIGVITLVSDDPERVFGDEEVRVLELLAAPAALAVSNARLAEAHASDLATAASVARALSGEIAPERVRRAICEAAIGVSGCRSAALLEPDGEGNMVSTAMVNTNVPRISLRVGEPSVIVESFTTGQPVFVPDASQDPRVSRAWKDRTQTQALVCQPVFRAGTVIGVLVLFWGYRVEQLTKRTRSVVALLADDAAAAIERANLFSRLDELARRDALTMTANRRSWEEELPRYLSRAGRDETSLSVAMMDLDHFKDFNDVQGHQRGDLLLREVTDGWRAELREGDLLARYGGEEFAVILAGCPLEEAVRIVERLRESTPAGQTCSAGVACWDGHESAEALVARADAALYEAKIAGRNRTVAAMPDVGHSEPADDPGTMLAGWTRWSGVLPRLLQEGTLQSVYQPVVRLADRAVVGYEALARPLGVGPDMSVEGLFAAAQYRGLGRDLDWLCRRAALTSAIHMPAGAALFVNVGVPALLDPLHDVDQMLLLLEHVGRKPQDVVLEITEREAVRDMTRFGEVLDLYRDHGFRFAIDDVGEGHSTLEVLATASPEFIKLARSLMISAWKLGPRSAIRAVVSFARSSGAEVIAEGIETAAEEDSIRELGVELGQGSHIAAPQLAPEAFALARALG